MIRVAVYCGSSPGRDPAYLAAAHALGGAIASRGFGVVYGGASVGLMGAVADGALAKGGEVVGVLPRSLLAREIEHKALTEFHLVESMHERKAKMAGLAHAFVAMPGGYGTFEEIFEVLTWSQIGLHTKPCALFDVGGYYEKLLAFLDHAVASGFLAETQRRTLRRFEEAGALLDMIAEEASPGFDATIT